MIALPFVAIGIVVHVVPFQIMKQVGKKPTNEGIKATVKLLGCFVLFVAVYVVVGVRRGPRLRPLGRPGGRAGRTALWVRRGAAA